MRHGDLRRCVVAAVAEPLQRAGAGRARARTGRGAAGGGAGGLVGAGGRGGGGVRAGVAGGGAAPGGGLEAQPARPGEVQLGPRVVVLAALHEVAVALVQAGGEADRDPGRDVQGAGHRGHRRREVHAEAGLVVQELDDRVVAGAGVHLEAVAEGAAGEPVLQRHRLVVRVLLARRDLQGGVRDELGQVVRHLGVLRQHVGGRGGGEPELVRGRLQVQALDAVPQAVGLLAVVADQRPAGGLVTPVARHRDVVGRVGQREPVGAEVLGDLDVGGDRGARDGVGEPVRGGQLLGEVLQVLLGELPLDAVEVVERGDPQVHLGGVGGVGGVAEQLDVALPVEVGGQGHHRVERGDAAAAPAAGADPAVQQPEAALRDEERHDQRAGQGDQADPVAAAREGVG